MMFCHPTLAWFACLPLLGEEAKNYSRRGSHWDSVVTPQLPSRSQLSDAPHFLAQLDGLSRDLSFAEGVPDTGRPPP